MFVRNKRMLSLVALLMISACNDDTVQKPSQEVLMPVAAAKVEPQNVPLSFEYAARAQGSKETQIRARVSGILMKRNYVEGSTVKAGDVLFQIDPEPYEVVLNQTQAKLANEKAKIKAAQTQWDRVEKLFKDRIVSEKTRDEARANLDSLKATIDLATAEVRAAQLNLDYTTVTAPISGITSMETQSEGSLISANSDSGSLLTTITQLDPIYVVFSASDSEMFKLGSMIETGEIINPRKVKDVKAKLRFSDGTKHDEEGMINFVNPIIDEKTGTIKMRTIFNNKDGKLMPGQFLRVVLEGLTRRNALILPKEAIMQGAKGSYVYRINAGGMVETVDVELGFTTLEGEWIIDKGLTPSDVVAISGLMKLRAGMKVKPEIKLIERNVVANVGVVESVNEIANVDEIINTNATANDVVQNQDILIEKI